MKNKIRLLIIVIGFSGSSSGCASVKGYQKMFLSDENMQLNQRKMEFYEMNIETYREGSSGGNGGKTGGGCGCN